MPKRGLKREKNLDKDQLFFFLLSSPTISPFCSSFSSPCTEQQEAQPPTHLPLKNREIPDLLCSVPHCRLLLLVGANFSDFSIS
ncbi:hypothetical protein SLEP1_g15154 [Rubroshorea leprosula]|uniref:Uncharacterized protein n=1 Tax=Rubroshorea leprosula TaxID=152421 RepID=A0AAV5ISE8_9ROSI|nr:hypothetical protein SLEP1_g15154 [Rubroshorea leprosula]